MLNDIEELSYSYYKPKLACWVIARDSMACGVFAFANFKLAKQAAKDYVIRHGKHPIRLSHNCINIQYVGSFPYYFVLIISLAPILDESLKFDS